MYETIKYQILDGIAYITINRPAAHNALNSLAIDELTSAFKEADADDSAGAVILTGGENSFASGADIAEMRDFTAIEGRAFSIKGHMLMNLIESMEKTVIAAINGYALGGGCELALACDIRIASERARFGHPEVNLGIIPGFGGTQRLPRLVGKGMGKYLILTGEIISADEATRIGLVERVVPPEELIGTAKKIAKIIMGKAPFAVTAAKTVINNGYDLDMKTACSYEIEAFTAPFGTEDKQEGMSAFLEKRHAAFRKR